MAQITSLIEKINSNLKKYHFYFSFVLLSDAYMYLQFRMFLNDVKLLLILKNKNEIIRF